MESYSYVSVVNLLDSVVNIQSRAEVAINLIVARDKWGGNGGVLVSPMPELVGPGLYNYYNCRNHVALHHKVIWKAFQVCGIERENC
ncbi:hypothetical protein MRB53_004387 [Persea americana]|uniref:Uncharacterized protein n=1 Tax=Persea americana TaxID=3435 RepID=A0ACC2MAA1_PERAE|nr:hypothetical protein MRB53_004387 [Persea americana]